MLRLGLLAAKRERNNTIAKFQQKYVCLSNGTSSIIRTLSSSSSTSSTSSPDVAVQLDYYMSLQFAGVATALVNDIYQSKGINTLQFLPTCPVGHELDRVRTFQDANPSTLATFGSVEQNIFTPTLYNDPSLNLSAVASMFRRSPLCIASLKPLQDGDVIGCHEDTVELLQRIFPKQKVVASPRGTKNSDLLDGTYNGIQAYTTTEVPALYHLMKSRNMDPNDLTFQVLEDVDAGTGSAPQLGYSQMLFVANEALESEDRRDATKAFLEGTFDGWQHAIRNPDEAIEAVKEAQKMLKLDDESNDHWHESLSFQKEMLDLVNNHVKETFVGDRLGVLSPRRWSKATDWLLHDKANVDSMFGMDQTGLWQPPSNLLQGNELAREALNDAKLSAMKFEQTYGRKPSLTVITVGELKRYTHSERRLQLYSNPSSSWFTKTDVGEANNFDVTEIQMDAHTTTDALLSEVYNKLRDTVDGIQIMWPLPSSIDSAKVYNAVPNSKDVDGINYTGWGGKYPPVTPAAAIALMKEYNVDVRGKHVIVVGRSPIVGNPMAHMLREAGACVTVAHTEVNEETLQGLAGQADVVVTCAGAPGCVDASWLKDGVEVINIGTTFCEKSDSLVSDVKGDLDAKASRYSPVPGGVGPLSIPMLFCNVANAAWDQKKEETSWEKEPASLRKSIHFDSYTEAITFCQKVDELSTLMDHHANMRIVHKCINGVDLELELSSFEAKELTEKDYDAARAIDLIHSGTAISMKDYSYNLKEESIALFPAETRGSSKLLRVNSEGSVSYFDHFGNHIPSLLEGCHVAFNNSRVLDARLSVDLGEGKEVELMLLDLGDINPAVSCSDHNIRAMIRSDSVRNGDVYTVNDTNVEIVRVCGIWEEEAESGGNGTDCIVKIHSIDVVSEFLESNGAVPIPPYLNREAVESDKERYNNVYAKRENLGSVAAPTAGLHFTDDVLKELGESNISSLTLHVGAGTFMPVLSKDARDHEMHAEHFFVNVGELRDIVNAMEAGKPLAVVGTTSTRTLESLHWLGVKRMRNLPGGEDIKQLDLGQFEWRGLSVADSSISAVSSFKSLIDGLSDDDHVSGKTQLMITPSSYKFKVIDHLVTNFHAPDSTLMLLVSTFLGEQSNVMRIYENAQDRGYRFLSYGDSCLFSTPGKKLPSEV